MRVNFESFSMVTRENEPVLENEHSTMTRKELSEYVSGIIRAIGVSKKEFCAMTGINPKDLSSMINTNQPISPCAPIQFVNYLGLRGKKRIRIIGDVLGLD